MDNQIKKDMTNERIIIDKIPTDRSTCEGCCFYDIENLSCILAFQHRVRELRCQNDDETQNYIFKIVKNEE